MVKSILLSLCLCLIYSKSVFSVTCNGFDCDVPLYNSYCCGYRLGDCCYTASSGLYLIAFGISGSITLCSVFIALYFYRKRQQRLANLNAARVAALQNQFPNQYSYYPNQNQSYVHSTSDLPTYTQNNNNQP